MVSEVANMFKKMRANTITKESLSKSASPDESYPTPKICGKNIPITPISRPPIAAFVYSGSFRKAQVWCKFILTV